MVTHGGNFRMCSEPQIKIPRKVHQGRLGSVRAKLLPGAIARLLAMRSRSSASLVEFLMMQRGNAKEGIWGPTVLLGIAAVLETQRYPLRQAGLDDLNVDAN
jgi:hypothetical protein